MNKLTLIRVLAEGLNMYKVGDKYYDNNAVYVVISTIPGLEGSWSSDEEEFLPAWREKIPHLEGFDDSL